MNQTDTEREEENIPETAKTIDKNAKKEKKKRSKVSYAIEYAIYVARVRKYAAEMKLEDAVNKAIEELKQAGLWVCGTAVDTNKYYYNQD